MPLPIPRDGEKQNDFISRCMSNDAMKKEFPDQKQRTAVCFQQFKRKKESIDDLKESVLNKKFDEQGREIIAENVPVTFSATIEELK